MNRHTPGPWTYLPRDGSVKPVVIRGREGGFQVFGLSADREDADAQLIAAAPDMLAALQRIAEYPRQRNDELSIAGARAIAAAAIAKATGEAQ